MSAFSSLAVFTSRGLEKAPTYKVPAMETFRMSKPGAKTSYANVDKEMFLERIMNRMRQRANERRVLAKPCFQDFDKYVFILEIYYLIISLMIKYMSRVYSRISNHVFKP